MSNENPDPYLQLLAEWEEDKRMLERYKEREMNKRLLLFAGAFPNPKEGTQKHLLPDGRTISAQYKINRKVDEAALAVTLAALKEAGVANTDALVRYKPELAIREWKSLSEDSKLTFSPAIISSPSAPTLEIIPAKET